MPFALVIILDLLKFIIIIFNLVYTFVLSKYVPRIHI